MNDVAKTTRSIIVAIAMLSIAMANTAWAKGTSAPKTIRHTAATASAGGWHGSSGTSSHHKGVPDFAKFEYAKGQAGLKIGPLADKAVQIGPKLPSQVMSQFNSAAIVKAADAPANINGLTTELAASLLDPRKDGPPHVRDSFRNKESLYYQTPTGIPGVKGLKDQAVNVIPKAPVDITGMKTELTSSQVGQRGDAVPPIVTHIPANVRDGDSNAWRAFLGANM